MKKLLSVILSLLMVFSAMPLTMMASAATVTAAGYTFDWLRGSDGANDFNEVITPVGDALTTKDYNDNTCMYTSRSLVVGDKLAYTTKDSVAKGLYKVIFELRAYTGRADLNIKVGDRDYGKFVSPSGGTNTKVTLFTDFVQAETAPVTIEFEALSAGTMYIEQLHFEKIEYEYTVDGTNATLTKYIGTGGDIEIPEKVDGYTVVGVGANCFKGCETLTSVKAYKNVASIGEGAFADCVGLEKITIDNGACEIFDSAETISGTAVISGGNKSTAQAYAEKYGREFEMITFATIGDESYSSLEEAFAAAQDGDRIVLVKDYDLTSSITTDKAVVLDLAGYTLKAPVATITTTADFEIASTVDGKGEEYSGAEVVEPSTDADKIGTVADISNKALYVKGHYPSSGKASIATYENRVAVNKLIEVKYGKNYIFNTGSGSVVTRFIIREYKADGSFIKSYGGVADGGTYTPSSADVEVIGVTIYIENNATYDILGSIQNGTFTPSAALAPVRGQIKFGSAFVKTSANFKMSNLKVTASATGSFYEQTDANATPKFTAYDCNFAVASNSVIRALKFSPNASEIDMQNSIVTMGNNNNGAGFSIASASVGTFKNVSFSMPTGVAVYIYNTGAEGVTFDGCTVKQTGYDQVAAMRVANGNVTLTGGTNISGDNKATNVLYVEGGKLTMDGVTVQGDKGSDTSRIVFYIKNTPQLVIKKATIAKGTANGAKGVITNDVAKLRAGIAEGCAAYKASTPSADSILTKDGITTALATLYIKACEHYCTGKQGDSTICNYCSLDTEISHDYSTIKYNETQHWGVCARCDKVQEAQDHAVGENGTAATCTEPAVCGVCAQNFGEELGHSFTDFQQVSTDVAGCEHNPVTKAICDNGCGEEEYDYSALVNLEVTKEAIAPTCTEEGATQEQSCTECQKVIEPVEVVEALGHDFGETTVEVEPDYLNTGKGSHSCLREGCGFSEEVVIPAKEFKGSTIAITGDYVNPNEFQTIQEAIDAAKDGETIIIVKDGKLEGSITLDKEIILDLNGHTLEATTGSASFVTDKNLEIRSTVLGLGEVYSGVVPVAPSTEEDTYGTIADVPNGDLYVMGHYNSGAGKLEAYENRIANKKLIAVDSSRSYIFKTGCNIQYVIREFNKKGRFAKSVGAITNGATYTPSSPDVAYIGVAFCISGDSTTDILSMIQNDEFNPTIELAPVKATIKFSKPFVKTSAQLTMSNIKASASAATTFVESSATDVAAPAKFVAKDCQFTASGTAQPLKFTANAMEIDVQDSSVYSTTGNGLEINSAGVFGTFKNTKITKNSNLSFLVAKTADAGIVFDGCSMSQGAWDSTASQVSGGKVTFTGGTSISGSNMASTVLNASGGTIIFDDASLSGDKGTDSSRKLINFSGSPKVIIKKATFTRGTANGAAGVITNNIASFRASLAEGSAFFNSSAMDGNSVISGADIKVSDKVVYVGECGHWERSVSKAETCTTAHTCNYCAMAFDALGHEYSAYDNDETTHWRICVRCKEVDPVDNEPEAHFGGTATCTEPAECEACQEYHGEALGHLFPEADADGKYSVEDYNFDEDTHWVVCTREDCGEAKEGTTQEHAGGEATCEDAAVCEDCGQEYGLALGHSYVRYESNNDASCNIDGTETAFCENGCGNSVSRVDEGSKLGHVWVEDFGYAATCKETGLTNGSHCDFCKMVREEQEVIPVASNAHVWDAGVIKQAGNCSTDMIFVYTCEECATKQEYNLGKVSDKHDFDTTYTVDKMATFQEEGSKSIKCKHCSATTGAIVIPKLAFSAKKVGNGIEVKWDSCDVEGVHYELERKVNNGQFILIQNYLTQAYCVDTTATVNATYVYRVTVVCGDVRSTSGEMTVVVGAQTPDTPTICVHSTVTKNAKAATYFATGYTGDLVCVKCNRTVMGGKVIAKLTLKVPKFKLIKGTKQFKVKYTKVADANKFQVRFRIKGKWKMKTFTAKKNITKTIKKLKAGKYQVQVRAMIVSGNLKAYSAWSKTKKVLVK